MCIALYNSNYNFECNCNLKYSWAQPDWTPPQICALLPDFSPTCWTPHFWFASTMSLFSQPMVFLMILDQSEVSTVSLTSSPPTTAHLHRRMSSSTSEPTLSLKAVNPSAMNLLLSRTIFSSE